MPTHVLSVRMYTSNNSRTNKWFYIKDGIVKFDTKWKGINPFQFSLWNRRKMTYFTWRPTPIFTANLEPSFLSIYRLEKLNPVCPIYFLMRGLSFAPKWTFTRTSILKNQQWSPNTFGDNKACLITIEASSQLHLQTNLISKYTPLRDLRFSQRWCRTVESSEMLRRVGL